MGTGPGPLQSWHHGGLLLAVDTAGEEGSVALALPVPAAHEVPEAGSPSFPIRMEILARASLQPEDEHASLLVPRIMELMEDASAGRERLSGIVVGAGPGSFTGLRVGAATAKGMAWALEIPLWTFSSLAAAAAELDGESPPLREKAQRPTGLPPDAGGDSPASGAANSGRAEVPQVRCVLFDARGDRMYGAAYRFGEGSPEVLLAPRATVLGEVLEGLIPPGAVLVGDGAWRHRGALEEAGHRVLPYPAGLPTARGLLRLLALDPWRPPVEDPGRWEPCYLRESGAERMWKTRRKWRD